MIADRCRLFLFLHSRFARQAIMAEFLHQRTECNACSGRYALATFGDTLTPTLTMAVGVGVRVKACSTTASAYLLPYALQSTFPGICHML